MKSYDAVLQEHPDLAGTKRYCNICGYRFSKFLSFSKLKPREARCPVCGSLERHRHLYVHLVHYVPFFTGKKLLHFAPEAIFKEFFMQTPVAYYDADINPQKVRYQVDITDIPFKDNFYDFIIAIHVLEHIEDDMQAMRELFRVLKPGGTAFLAVPCAKEAYENPAITSPEEREKAFGQNDHVRWYSLSLFLERLAQAGFNVDRVSLPQNIPNHESLHLSDSIVLAQKL